MTVSGIVAEYNPFHTGHAFHIAETRMHCDATVAVMSGNLVQRCEPAVCEKRVRAQMAIGGGVDLVLCLPVRYALGSAERFALGAVTLLDALGVVDMLSFGSECGDIDRLQTAASEIDALTSDDYKAAQRSGCSFAAARQSLISVDISRPNDLLAVEYLRALTRIGSKIAPFTVKRTDRYHETATLHRERIGAGELSSLPDYTAKLLKIELDAGRAPSDMKNIERLLLGFMRSARHEDFDGIYGINEADGFANRLINAADAVSLDGFYTAVKTKRYTMSAVRRAVFSAYLRLKNTPVTAPYAHVLAFNDTGRDLLKRIQKNIRTVHNLANIVSDFPELADEERRATELFSLSLPTIGAGHGEYERVFYDK